MWVGTGVWPVLPDHGTALLVGRPRSVARGPAAGPDMPARKQDNSRLPETLAARPAGTTPRPAFQDKPVVRHAASFAVTFIWG